jgi:hypothetical protein
MSVTNIIVHTFGQQVKLPANLREGDFFERQAVLNGKRVKNKNVRFEVRNAVGRTDKERPHSPKKCIVGVLDGVEARVYPY